MFVFRRLGSSAVEEICFFPCVWKLLNIMAFNGMLGKFPSSHDDKAFMKSKRAKLEELYDRTKSIVEKNRSVFDILVPVLVEKKTMTGQEVMSLIGEKVEAWQSITSED